MAVGGVGGVGGGGFPFDDGTVTVQRGGARRVQGGQNLQNGQEPGLDPSRVQGNPPPLPPLPPSLSGWETQESVMDLAGDRWAQGGVAIRGDAGMNSGLGQPQPLTAGTSVGTDGSIVNGGERDHGSMFIDDDRIRHAMWMPTGMTILSDFAGRGPTKSHGPAEQKWEAMEQAFKKAALLEERFKKGLG
ncbi:MAG: hypothetical protein U1E65_02800 [Myxococcota bacterium]